MFDHYDAHGLPTTCEDVERACAVTRQVMVDAGAEITRLRAALARAEQATADTRAAERARIVTWIRDCARTVARGTEPDAAIAWLATTLESESLERCAVCGHDLDKHRRGGCGDVMPDGSWCQCIGASEALAADVPAAPACACPEYRGPTEIRIIPLADCPIHGDVPAAGELACGCPAVGVFAKGCPQHGDHPAAIGAAASEPEVKP